jgi:hypothetical protein
VGFSVGGGAVLMAGNTAVGNLDGFHNDDVSGNRFLRNLAVGNQSGIHNSLGTKATFRRNLALENDETDLIDSRPNCDDNVWDANTYAVVNKPCVENFP